MGKRNGKPNGYYKEMMSENEIRDEIKILERKINRVQSAIEPIIKIEKDFIESFKKKYPNLSFSFNIRKVSMANVNISRWRVEKEVYQRILENRKMNRQMLDPMEFLSS